MTSPLLRVLTLTHDVTAAGRKTVPPEHPRSRPGRVRMPHLRAALDELVDAGVLPRRRRDGIECPIWAAVHGLAVLTGPGPLRDVPDATRRHFEELTLTFINEGLA